ncbi:hypothetical protein SUGI_0995510 [Cryptomeria japonica]|uniref:dihydroflavonol 4-reductase n=1 Tax=Cryptomeria japonica TaxID=3369 RepID=UPI0024147B39|nr:dihydroflavonol 4-reductase [Cryptomeria japonica]XP_059069590.1 dihydroflavonol 4-reductase [Cryptomeria japonica]XP_059069591.1 dihydroflavonol 4-reductase [Cryptomeria japonica]XP_059069592.1 dihydroflavonol 4-reductase [Cryptomeria japonica]GLJ47150.1 hypothetical protein SUGI_0995510 [Cryptomeria japonica]
MMNCEIPCRQRVCVTAAGGFITSCLIKNLLERGYIVNATCREPDNLRKTSHLLSLPGAKERLYIFKADLFEQGSFDSAIEGCDLVINMATSLDYTRDPENGFIQPTIDGTLDILRACKSAKTVRRVIHTSSITAATPVDENGKLKDCLDESCWTPINYMRREKPQNWMYYVAKTLAEQAALQYGEDNEIEVITVLAALVGGPSIAPTLSSALITLTPITGNQECCEILTSYQSLMGSVPLVHVEDVCNAHMMLMEHPSARGRYLCCSDAPLIPDMADFFRKLYPEIPIIWEFEETDVDQEVQLQKRPVRIASSRLSEVGFAYKYGMEEIISHTVEWAKKMQVL